VRFGYRVRQFWHALTATPDPDELAQARRMLSPSLMALFRRMKASEQAHSLSIFCQLRDRNGIHEDLLVAALLHDVGKSRFPLRLWERVLIVLGKSFTPERVKTWGSGEPRGWKRAFVVAEQHAVWGAEMAAEAGASPMVVSIIRRHQEPLAPVVDGQGEALSLEDRCLYHLQLLDNES
jgi:putative nucleotidyltransferase with HDIG domain